MLKKGLESEHRPDLWMSAFIFLCCLYLSPWMLGYAGWYGRDVYREVLFFLPLQHYFLMGPVIYFYSKSLLNPGRAFSRRDGLHFLPAIAYIGYAAVMFIADVWILDDYYFYADGRDKDLHPLYQITGTLHLVVYVSLSIRVYFRYRTKIYNELSFADTVVHTWFKQFLIVLVIILAARTIFLIIYPEWGNFAAKFWYYFIFSVLLYYISLQSYTHSITFALSYHLPASQTPNVAETVAVARPSADIDSKKHLLEKAIGENKLYLNPTLTLDDLSRELDVSRELVSTIINQGFGMNFNDYINSFRIEEIKKRFEQGDTTSFTVLGIALDSGFNSKTTFNRAFKKHTGLTPLQYLRKKEETDGSIS